jgi:nucleotide-binding universal stress UspA family protein
VPGGSKGRCGDGNVDCWASCALAGSVREAAIVSTPEVAVPEGPEKLTIETILVPLDGSDLAERALPVAQELAKRLGAEIHLVAVAGHGRRVAEMDVALDGAPIGTERVHRVVLAEADPVRALVAHLGTLAHPAVCMATHGRGRSAAILGSVAAELVTAAGAPVVVVGPAIGDVAPWIPVPREPAGVVACVDKSPASAGLVWAAVAWGGLLGESVEVVVVAEPVPAPIGSAPARRRFGPDGDPEVHLESLVAPARQGGAVIFTRVLWDPISPAEGVRDHLREHPASLVVVGTRGRQGVARILAGSVGAGIVRNSPSPVLLLARAPRD